MTSELHADAYTVYILEKWRVCWQKQNQIISILYTPCTLFRVPCRANAAKIAIVITDGKSQSPSATAQEAQKLRDKGITVFSIGVGSGIQESELKAMATDPDNQHVFVVNNFDALDLIKASLQQKACEGKAFYLTIKRPVKHPRLAPSLPCP